MSNCAPLPYPCRPLSAVRRLWLGRRSPVSGVSLGGRHLRTAGLLTAGGRAHPAPSPLKLQRPVAVETLLLTGGPQRQTLLPPDLLQVGGELGDHLRRVVRRRRDTQLLLTARHSRVVDGLSTETEVTVRSGQVRSGQVIRTEQSAELEQNIRPGQAIGHVSIGYVRVSKSMSAG